MGDKGDLGRVASLFATFLLLVGIASTIYVHSFKDEKQMGNTIVIHEVEYDIGDIFASFEEKAIEEFSGISLSDLLNATLLKNPENYEYRVVGEDRYAKTVEWNHMKNGILTRERNVVFSDLPRQFWVRDVAKIEVK